MNNQIKLPNTAAGRLMAQFFDLYNSGDARGIREFVAAYYADPNAFNGPDEDRAIWSCQDYTTSLVKAIEYDQHCGLHLRTIEADDPSRVAVLAQSGLAGEWLYLKMTAAHDNPERLFEFRTRPTVAPPHLIDHKLMSIDQLGDELDRFVGRLNASDIFSGVIAVAKDGECFYERAFGLASRDYGVLNSPETKFNIGSGNKMFTAVVIAQLVEQGKLHFEDTLASILPEFPHSPEKITIHQLLAHLSGIGSYWNKRFEAQRSSVRSVNDFLRLFIDDPLLMEPGERWLYSNGGYIVLGAIIERITGRSYYEVVREAVYQQAGMDHTDAYEVDRPIPNLAVGYTDVDYEGNRDLSGVRNNLFMHVIKGGPGGGGFSTVGDLLKFDTALRSHRLISPELTAEVLGGKVNLRGDDLHYAYGFWDRRVNGQRITGHAATFPGIGGQFDMFLNSGYTIAILSNADPVASQVVVDYLRDALTRI